MPTPERHMSAFAAEAPPLPWEADLDTDTEPTSGCPRCPHGEHEWGDGVCQWCECGVPMPARQRDLGMSAGATDEPTNVQKVHIAPAPMPELNNLPAGDLDALDEAAVTLIADRVVTALARDKPVMASLQISRKVSDGNYGSIEASIHVTGVTSATTEAEIDALIDGAGAITWRKMTAALNAKMRESEMRDAR